MAIVKTDVYDVQAPLLLDLRNRKADINGRNAIGTAQRDYGLLCYTIAENVLWMLAGGLTNNDWVQVWPATAPDTPTTSSLVTASADVELNWGATATGPDGLPVAQTWAQRYGNTPIIQVWLDTGSGWSLEVVPITFTMSGSNIASVDIETGSINSRIIIK